MGWMGGVAGGSAAAAGAAAAQRQREKEEEERLTTYNPEDLQQDWEFKIVRSSLGVFRNPETLRKLIDEEARAGWQFLEKFDDHRVRFKRPASARAEDHLLHPDVNPYRTHYGANGGLLAVALLGGLLVVGVLALVFAVILFA